MKTLLNATAILYPCVPAGLALLCVFLGACQGQGGEEDLIEEDMGDAVDTVILGLDFQDGFRGDSIVVRVDGKSVYHEEGITTQLLLGVADSFTTRVRRGAVQIDILVETQDLARSISLEVLGDTYLGVSIVAGELQSMPPRDEPFPYA